MAFTCLPMNLFDISVYKCVHWFMYFFLFFIELISPFVHICNFLVLFPFQSDEFPLIHLDEPIQALAAAIKARVTQRKRLKRLSSKSLTISRTRSSKERAIPNLVEEPSEVCLLHSIKNNALPFLCIWMPACPVLALISLVPVMVTSSLRPTSTKWYASLLQSPRRDSPACQETPQTSPRPKETIRRLLARGRVNRGRPTSRLLQNAIWNAYQFALLEHDFWKKRGKPVIPFNRVSYVHQSII